MSMILPPIERFVNSKLDINMGKKVVTVTHPDGTKKVIVGQRSNQEPVKTREGEEDKRAKPGTPKIGISHERNGYRKGGKIKFKTC